MSWRTVVRDNASSLALGLLKALGETATYESKGTNLGTVYVDPGDEEISLQEILGTQAEVKGRVFTIPKQTGTVGAFPATGGPNIGDILTWNSIAWNVEKIESDTVGAAYELTCIKKKVQKLGTGK